MNKKRWTGALVAAALLATLVPSAANAAKVESHAQDRLLVKVKAGKDISSVAAKHGATAQTKDKLGTKSPWQVLHVPAGQADAYYEQLRTDADIEAVAYDEVLTANVTTPNDPVYPSQWHLPKIQANYAWDITVGSTQRTIAIVDTGVDLVHSDLKNKIVPGYDFVNNDSVAQDDQGHGTHVAGIAAASTNNAIDAAGVDWNAKIMPVKVLDKAGSGYTSNIINGIYWAADHGANVINLSLGGASYNQAFQDAINYAYSKNCIIVAAAGNSATSTPQYPAGYSNVVAVANTTSSDALASSSNYGTWIDIAAPGTSITSLKMGGGTVTMSGTSMSAPVVAGVMTLTWSMHLTYANSAIIKRVLSTADPISGTGTYWSNGRVNAFRAVNGY